jgi:hypothetical protein
MSTTSLPELIEIAYVNAFHGREAAGRQHGERRLLSRIDAKLARKGDNI